MQSLKSFIHFSSIGWKQQNFFYFGHCCPKIEVNKYIRIGETLHLRCLRRPLVYQAYFFHSCLTHLGSISLSNNRVGIGSGQWGQGHLGSGPRCGSGSLDHYKSPDMLDSTRALLANHFLKLLSRWQICWKISNICCAWNEPNKKVWYSFAPCKQQPWGASLVHFMRIWLTIGCFSIVTTSLGHSTLLFAPHKPIFDSHLLPPRKSL